MPRLAFSGVTKSGRVWRKVPESDARSVCGNMGWETDMWRRHAAGWGLHSQGDCSCYALLFFFSAFFLSHKLQALVYDILPPTTGIVDYVIGLEKLSANEVF